MRICIAALVIGACLIAIAPSTYGNDAGPDTATAPAPAEVSTADAVALGSKAVSQVVSKEWWAALSTGGLLLVWFLRFSLQKWSHFEKWVLSSKLGGPLFTLVVAFLGAFATPLANGPPSLEHLKVAALAAVIAIGGWHALVKRVIIPLAQFAWAKVR